MSEENNEIIDSEEAIDLGELTPEQMEAMFQQPDAEQPSGVTAFIIIKKPAGDWYATADLSTNILVERQATMDDIKHGCQDVVDSMFQTNIAYQIMDLVQNHLKQQETTQD
jgi:hypothetical protein